MGRQTIILNDFTSGELSPLLRGRSNIESFFRGAERMENFIPLPQGGVRFRSGTRQVLHTRRNNPAVLIPFVFNDEEAYICEFTAGFVRFFANEGFIVEASKTITGATQANPVVVTTSAGHGYSDGDEVLIEAVVGMTEINDKTFVVANKAATTFELTDNDGNNIDGTGFTAYSSAGTTKKIVEVASPYLEADLFKIKFAQEANTMYLTINEFEPRKLTRTSATSFTLSRFDRTSDPFTDKKVPTAITVASPGVVTTSAAHGYSNGDEVIFEDIGGMVELNGTKHIVANKAATTFEISSTVGFTAFAASGNDYVTPTDEFPVAVAFYESSLFYGGTPTRFQSIFKSRAPSTTTGASRYDDMTVGTNADDGVIYVLASRQPSPIRAMAGNDRQLSVFTYGAEYKVTGSTAEQAITPTSINVRPVSYYGAADQNVAVKDNLILFVQRGKRIVRSFEFSDDLKGYISPNQTLLSEHITLNGVEQLAFGIGEPDLLWGVKGDGDAIALLLFSREQVSGWSRHTTGISTDKFTSVASMALDSGFEQMWFVVERVVDGNTRRYNEFIEDYPVIPERDDFFTGAANETSDDTTFKRAMFEAQKEYVHVDSARTYDGTALGSDNSATLTPGATTGTGVTFTASAAVFASTDVGRELWKKAIVGVGTGRATITSFTNTTNVVCDIKVDFDVTTAMAAGNWYITTNTVSLLDHLEARTVMICADGGEHPTKVVSSGSVTLDYQASKVHVGLQYSGTLKTMTLEAGGVDGSAQGKVKNIKKADIRFLNTLGAFFGTDFYKMQALLFRSTADVLNRPPPLFSGIKNVKFSDKHGRDKQAVVKQDSPTPCIVQFVSPKVSTADG